MKLWIKCVVVFWMIAGLGLLLLGDYAVWGQADESGINLLTITHGGQDDAIPDGEDVDPGAFTAGSPTGDPITPYEFQPMKLQIIVPSDVPGCEESYYPVKLELTEDNKNIMILNDEKEGEPIDIDTHTFESSTLVLVKATAPSQELGDIEITATCEGCEAIEPDVVKATAVVVDLDIDSDNDETFSVNFDRDNDDIEDDATKPGKFLAVNDGDADNDGIPDFADFETSAVYQENTPVRFTPLVLELPEPLELEKVKIRLTYSASDPNGVTGSGTQADPYAAAPGHLRIWKVDGSVNRNIAEVSPGGEGHYVKPDSEYTPSTLGPGREIRLFVEGIKESASMAEQQIKVAINPNGDDEEPGFIGEDAVRVTVIRVDLDIDSDNNNGLNDPDQGDYEDHIENIQDDVTKLGKLVAANMGDVDDGVDNDGVPNFADGFNKYGNEGANAGGNFVPLILELPEPLDVANVKIRLTYSNSDPNGVNRTGQGTLEDPHVYSAAPGHLRIWTVNGSVDRKIAEVNAAGHFVKSGAIYNATNFDLRADRTIRLYVEGIDGSAAIADQPVRIEIDPNGDEEEPEFMCEDKIRTTVAKLEITEVHCPNGDENSSFTTQEPENAIHAVADIEPDVFDETHNDQIEWTIDDNPRDNYNSGDPAEPPNGHEADIEITIPPVPEAANGRDWNTLSYKLKASLAIEDTEIESMLKYITQDEVDMLRQQYIDMEKDETPERDEFINDGSTANFDLNEGACRCGHHEYHIWSIMNDLENVRANLGHPMTINSGYRCPIHNASPDVGGAANSQHIYGTAADVGAQDWNNNGRLDDDVEALEDAALAAGATFTQRYVNRVHMDWREE